MCLLQPPYWELPFPNPAMEDKESFMCSPQGRVYYQHVGTADAEIVLYSILPYIRGGLFVIQGGECREQRPLHLTIFGLFFWMLLVFYPTISLTPFMPYLLSGPRLWVFGGFPQHNILKFGHEQVRGIHHHDLSCEDIPNIYQEMSSPKHDIKSKANSFKANCQYSRTGFMHYSYLK